ncbi:MAG: sodium:solute symporter family protein [Candidatus Latescibacterota bacterium]
MSQFSLLDGGIVGLYLLATMVAGVAVRKYVGKVEDFLVAGREVNVYLGIASLAATEFGIVTCMYTAQSGYMHGFAGMTPGLLSALTMFLVGYTGFCIKPLRDSGVMTIPELLERRYGSRIRWAAGVVIVLGGLLNMGVFLRTGGEFLVVATGLDVNRLEMAMTVLLLGVAVYTIMGGMLSVLITDFLQFVVMSLGLLAVTLLILANVGWDRLTAAVTERYGSGGYNPLANPEMGWEYVLFNVLLTGAAVLTWQTSIARVLAAKDTQTGRRIYTRTSFFFVSRWLIPGLWGIAALATLAPQAFHALSPEMQEDPTLYAMPLFLSTFVPTGLMGLMIAAMLAADMSTDSSYMLTWGSVIYNDIMAPFHRRQWSERKGLMWNRFIVACIGVFLLVFGLWYELEGDLWTYLMLTGTIYLASVSSLLIACCYWKRANNWGAAASIVVSAAIPVAYLVMQKVPATRELAQQIGPNLSGVAAYALSGVAMVVGSLLKPRTREVMEEVAR